MSCRKLVFDTGPLNSSATPDLLRRAVRTGIVGHHDAWEVYRAMLAVGRRLERVGRDQFGR